MKTIHAQTYNYFINNLPLRTDGNLLSTISVTQCAIIEQYQDFYQIGQTVYNEKRYKAMISCYAKTRYGNLSKKGLIAQLIIRMAYVRGCDTLCCFNF